MNQLNKNIIVTIFLLTLILPLTSLVAQVNEQAENQIRTPREYYNEMQRKLASGWNTWNTRSVLSHVFLPDPLDRRLALRRIELIAPHKSNRIRPATQDRRPLRRYRRRWKIERLFAWLHNFRRISTRNEFYLPNYLAFVELGCITILLRNGF